MSRLESKSARIPRLLELPFEIGQFFGGQDMRSAIVSHRDADDIVDREDRIQQIAFPCRRNARLRLLRMRHGQGEYETQNQYQ